MVGICNEFALFLRLLRMSFLLLPCFDSLGCTTREFESFDTFYIPFLAISPCRNLRTIPRSRYETGFNTGPKRKEPQNIPWVLQTAMDMCHCHLQQSPLSMYNHFSLLPHISRIQDLPKASFRNRFDDHLLQHR